MSAIRKIVSTIVFVFLMIVLPLLFKPGLLFHYKTIIILAGALAMFFTQPAFSIQEVVTNKKAGFNAWSRSVALYLLPKLLNREAALVIASNPVAKEEHLVQETRNYVLSILK